MKCTVFAHRWGAVGLAAFLLVMQAGCGRPYRLIGRVVISANEPSSRIVELIPGPVPMIGVPIAGARVELFHGLDRARRPIPNLSWTRTDSTKADGTFEFMSYAAPGNRAEVGLKVSAAGYVTAYRTYTDFATPDEQYFLVLLVPVGETSALPQ